MNHSTTKESEFLHGLSMFLPLYTRATIGHLEACHQAVEAGRELDGIVPDRTADWVRAAYEQTRHTESLLDQWRSLSDEQLVNLPLNEMDDFSLATYAQYLFELELSDSPLEERIRARNVEAQVACLRSAQGSELVDYDWMFSDLLGYDMVEDEAVYDDLMLRSLAHNLRFKEGQRAPMIIAEIATDHLAADRLELGVELFSNLLETYRDSFEILEAAAIAFRNIQFAGVAERILREAMALAHRTGDYHHEVDDLAMMVKMSSGSDHPCTPEEQIALRRVEIALSKTLPTQSKRCPQRFTRRLFPSIDDVPVKTGMNPVQAA